MGDTKEYIRGDKHVHQAGSVMIKFIQYNVPGQQSDWKQQEVREAEVVRDDGELIEKLKPIFYNNEEDVKLFLKESTGMKPGDITDLVNRWVKDKRISDYGYSRKGVLWEILYEAGLYTKSRQNWCKRVD